MIDIIRDWYSRNFSDPQAVILVLLLLVLFGLLWLVGDILAPVLVALVLAYLLEGVVATMQRWRVPRTAASVFVLLLIITISLIVLFGLVPVLSQQLTGLVREIPGMIQNIQIQRQQYAALSSAASSPRPLRASRPVPGQPTRAREYRPPTRASRTGRAATGPE